MSGRERDRNCPRLDTNSCWEGLAAFPREMQPAAFWKPEWCRNKPQQSDSTAQQAECINGAERRLVTSQNK
ncbi:hypothetical protein FKM82_013329 [Ascaphus truei]